MKQYTLIIFGGTGDLSKRKLIPAVLALTKKDPDLSITVLGIGRTSLTDKAYREKLLAKSTLPSRLKIHYYTGDVSDPATMTGLGDRIRAVENGIPDGRIYYLATSYELFGQIARIIRDGSRDNEPFFTRVIAEKPFGSDKTTFAKLDREMKTFFTGDQIYRADHYLAKDTVDNIIRTRFSNPLFESVWSSEFISKITVAVEENIGVENRLDYYDHTGAIKDMVQNHLLQTLSLVLMNISMPMDDLAFREAKIHAISNLYFDGKVLTGQYRGYQDEVTGLNPGSKTETFVELKLRSKDPRWKDSDIVLLTGKKLAKQQAYIEIEFKNDAYKCKDDFRPAPNKLILEIQPLQNVELSINTTLPGEKARLVPVKMTFCPTCEFEANTPEAYETIIDECIKGSKRLFMSSDELNIAWQLTDSVLDFIKDRDPLIYEHGNMPKEQ